MKLQLDVSDEMADLLESLKDDTHATSRAEVVREAVSVYAVLVRERLAGRNIHIVSHVLVHQLILPQDERE